MASTDKHWARFGETDPYLKSVKSLDPYKRGVGQTWDLNEYFRTGERYIAEVFQVIERCVVPNFKPRVAVDFGCSVGRVALPLAKRSGEVIGLDVAHGALREAAENARRLAITNVDWRSSDDELSQITGPVDFFHSYNVLQHLTVKRGLTIFRRALSKLRPGGVIAVHVPYADTGSSVRRFVNWTQQHVPGVNRLANIARRRRHDYPQMLMNTYTPASLFASLVEYGCQHAHCTFIDQGRYPGVVLIAQVRL